MKPINIYNLTRIYKPHNVSRLERQMSHRDYYLKIKNWELQGLKLLSENLPTGLEFYYSFQIPKIGKEFDLLRVSEDYIINIELKSGFVSDDKIRKQLLQNRYYMMPLGRAIKLYTFISGENRLVRLTNGDRLVEATFDELVEDLGRQTDVYTGDVEELFKEENYLISPLSDPERFLERSYSLTSQQWDIRNNILGNIRQGGALVQGFTGLPGTGKTLLLYDIAMELSRKQKVCVLHCGSFPEELGRLSARLKRIEFVPSKNMITLPPLDEYTAIFVDEGHRIEPELFDSVVEYSKKNDTPVIISYDSEDSVSIHERKRNLPKMLEGVKGYVGYKLTNRIRMNVELSSFINCIMNPGRYHRRNEYPSASVAYANDISEATKIIDDYICNGYIYIKHCDKELLMDESNAEYVVEAQEATCREYDNVVMLLDENYEYDEAGYLRSIEGNNTAHLVRHLFHGMNRAKVRLAVVVLNNEEVFERILEILQH